MDCIGHGVAKSQTQPSSLTFPFPHMYLLWSDAYDLLRNFRPAKAG